LAQVFAQLNMFIRLVTIAIAHLATTFSVQQVHISYGESDSKTTSISISWKSDPNDPNPSVSYGTSQNNLNMQAAVKRSCTYFTSGPHKHVLISGLDFEKKYYYRINGMTSVKSFTTAPSAKSTNPFTISLFGDLGAGTTGDDTRARLQQLKSSVKWFLHVGDIAYADDAYKHNMDYDTVYDGFMKSIEGIAAEYPYMVTQGNHDSENPAPKCLQDANCKSGMGNFAAYNCRWQTPGREHRGHNMWYSFDFGPIHFVSINTETDFHNAPEEHIGNCKKCAIPAGSFGRTTDEYLNWLKADLEAANKNRKERPWIIVYGHRPFYVLEGTKAWEPELVASTGALVGQYADIYITGHVHYYSRGIPTQSSITDRKFKPLHLVVGGAGNEETTVQFDKKSGTSKFYDFLGYSKSTSTSTLTLVNKYEIQIKSIVSKSGDVFDGVKVTKDQTTFDNTFTVTHKITGALADPLLP